MPGYRSRFVKPTLVLWTLVVTIALATRVFTTPTATATAILSILLVGLGVLAWRHSGRSAAAMVASRPAPGGYLGQHRARHWEPADGRAVRRPATVEHST